MRVSPGELTALITAVANGLYHCLSPWELEVVAAIFDQLGDTLGTLAAQAALLEARRGNTENGAG